jgi:N6-adenosine-specific RNA methylase IME4
MTANTLALPGRITPTGLELPPDLTVEEWLEIGLKLQSVERSVMWWLGDWLRYGERKYGEMYSQALEETDYSYQTLADAAWVAGKVEFSRRRENLPFSHHREVAPLPPEQQDEILDAAQREAWSRNAVRAEVNRRKNSAVIGSLPSSSTCTVEDLSALSQRGDRFGTIYADPPWLYGNQGTRAATGNHYGGMTVEEIAALPIRELAADNAHLHLWTTNAFLFDCKAIMEAWGFEYKSCFVWVKPQMGLGNYWRLSHEFMLFGVRGSAPFRARDQKSWLECARGKHSAKPEQVRQMIEKVSPGPYLELFGRSTAQGWTVWGNQIERNLFYQHDQEAA